MSLRATVGALAPIGALVGSMTSLCLGASYARTLFSTLGAAGTTTFRVSIAALIIFLLRRPWRRPVAARDLCEIALYGGALGAMNLMFYMAIRTVPLGLTIAIEFVGPLAVAVWSSRRVGHLAWIGLALLGLALLLPLRVRSSPLDPVGVAFALGAALCWAVYILCGHRLGRLDGGQVVSIGLGIAALVVLPFGITGAGSALLDPTLMASGFAVAVLSSALPYSLEIYALRKLQRGTFSVMLSLEPAIGALVGFAFLGQSLAPTQLLAVACIVVASAGSARGFSR